MRNITQRRIIMRRIGQYFIKQGSILRRFSPLMYIVIIFQKRFLCAFSSQCFYHFISVSHVTTSSRLYIPCYPIIQILQHLRCELHLFKRIIVSKPNYNNDIKTLECQCQQHNVEFDQVKNTLSSKRKCSVSNQYKYVI